MLVVILPAVNIELATGRAIPIIPTKAETTKEQKDSHSNAKDNADASKFYLFNFHGCVFLKRKPTRR